MHEIAISTGSIDVIGTLLWMIGGLLAALVGVIAWVGGRIHSRLDSMSNSISAIQLDLHTRVSVIEKEYQGFDRRILHVENTCKSFHL